LQPIKSIYANHFPKPKTINKKYLLMRGFFTLTFQFISTNFAGNLQNIKSNIAAWDYLIGSRRR
jgi:hypothetical protein